ncbi:MAG TPA: aspartate aminotransferase family protein, partial [Thermoanaerobaculia bacterium]|nr:aspartate aminotransferase family protein [Thermoanaerobaculia bacterium]
MTSFGDLLPRIVTPPPGPRSRALSRDLRDLEAPGVNTLPPGDGASVLWEEARGANVRDVDGNLYIDLTSGFGVAAVGHRHPRVVAAVREQAGRLLHGLGDVAAHPLRVELARRLVRIAPVDDPQVFFSISGSEAVEIALKTAVAATGRPGVVAFEPSYHGLTLGALAATSREEFRAPFAAHLHPHVHRLPYACDPGRVEDVLRRGDVGAVILEPIVGREGVLVPPAGWLPAVAEICRRHSVLLIADEIFTGFGRTGRIFAVEHEEVRPDLLCCGKALGGGLPVAAVLGRRDLFRCWETPGEARHTATFLANPVACAAALAALDVLEEED